MTEHKDNPQIRPAPDRVKIWPFTAIDRPDGERAWSGGHWGSLSATMPHSTEYVRADLAQSALDAAEAKLALAVGLLWRNVDPMNMTPEDEATVMGLFGEASFFAEIGEKP